MSVISSGEWLKVTTPPGDLKIALPVLAVAQRQAVRYLFRMVTR
jgi:hypothetical protein